MEADPHHEGSGLLAVPSQQSPFRHLRRGDRTEGRLLLKSLAGPGHVNRKASSQKQMIRFSSSKTLASSGFIKFPFRLSEENKGRKLKRWELLWLLPVCVPKAPYSNACSILTCMHAFQLPSLWELGLTKVTSSLYKPEFSAVFQACLS